MLLQQFGPLEQQADAAQAQRRIRPAAHRHPGGQRLHILLATPIEHADGDGIASHGLDDAAIGVELRVLIGQLGPVHEEEFRAQQANALGAGLGDQRQFGGNFQIGLQLHQFSIGGLGR